VPAATAPDALHFCAVCNVSVPQSEIARGIARFTPKGRLFCGLCVAASPQERQRRRAALEAEFADRAPVPIPFDPADEPPPIPVPATPPATSVPPVSTAADAHDAAFLAARIGELERAAFRLQSRVERLEEQLREALRRLG
jgi:hypothetical protein